MINREKITKDTLISKSLEMNPFAAEILMDAGIGCLGCVLAKVETLEQGLSAHGLDSERINLIIEEMNKE